MFEHLGDRQIRDSAAWLRSTPAVADPGLKKTWLSDKVQKQRRARGFPS